MNNKVEQAPLYEKLINISSHSPISFHVPGHKNGKIFPKLGYEKFKQLLSIDLTELTGLDDLHAPSQVIKEAQDLAANWFQSKKTYFLVGGSTVGNLAMILATCSVGDKVIVQRNCHKSILNGLELSGAHPIFMAPVYDERVKRYTTPTYKYIKKAIEDNPKAKAIVLTYPDYFGHTFNLKEVVEFAHSYGIPVLVDEAHGVHFSLGNFFPETALESGADVVVQSAHKMAPAMTMASFLHVNSSYVAPDRIEHFLQMLQSSSPSYPLLASLDLSRLYLQSITKEELEKIQTSVGCLRDKLSESQFWSVLQLVEGEDDPLKITIQISDFNAREVATLFEKENIYPELTTHNQILFIHGLSPFTEWERLDTSLKKINGQLKSKSKRAKIDEKELYFSSMIQSLTYSYGKMNKMETIFLPWEQIDCHIAAEAIIPYPPGIPIIAKGENITNKHKEVIKYLVEQGTTFQNLSIKKGLKVFLNRFKGE